MRQTTDKQIKQVKKRCVWTWVRMRECITMKKAQTWYN